MSRVAMFVLTIPKMGWRQGSQGKDQGWTHGSRLPHAVRFSSFSILSDKHHNFPSVPRGSFVKRGSVPTTTAAQKPIIGPEEKGREWEEGVFFVFWLFL